jgi:hypothetical protein
VPAFVEYTHLLCLSAINYLPPSTFPVTHGAKVAVPHIVCPDHLHPDDLPALNPWPDEPIASAFDQDVAPQFQEVRRNLVPEIIPSPVVTLPLVGSQQGNNALVVRAIP